MELYSRKPIFSIFVSNNEFFLRYSPKKWYILNIFVHISEVNMAILKSIYIAPHPPIILPSIGKGKELEASKTIAAMISISDSIVVDNPDTIIIMSPHAKVFADYFNIYSEPLLLGSLAEFGDEETISFENDIELVKQIGKVASAYEFPAGMLSTVTKERFSLDDRLDHGALVPMHFVIRSFKKAGKPMPKLVLMAISGMTLMSHFELGKVVAHSIEDYTKDSNISVIASGDLSHRVSEESPYGFNDHGPELDDIVQKSIIQNDPSILFTLNHSLRENAGDCGVPSIAFAFGLMDEIQSESELLSYEAPFGIGYCVAKFATSSASKKSQLDKISDFLAGELHKLHSKMGPIAFVAMKALETYIRSSRIITTQEALEYAKNAPVEDEHQLELLDQQFGSFVCIKKDGSLRGCIGTIQPTKDTLLEEIIHNAISSGSNDNRFDKVDESELKSLEYTVDVLYSPESIESLEELDHIKYGVIVEKGSRRGVLLPDLEGVTSVQQQISIALSKAGISPEENYKINKFQVVRFK